MTVLQALDRYYGRLVERKSAVPIGYVEQQIGYVVVLNNLGEIISVNKLVGSSAKQPFQVMVVPAPVTSPKARTAGSIVPYFLWDKPSYLLGVSQPAKSGTKAETRVREKYASSRRLHLRLLAEAKDPLLTAVRSFFDRHETGAPEELIPLDRRDRPMVFALDGTTAYAHDIEEARELWAKHEPREEWARGFCLVKGAYGSIERLHPKITGFRDADALVSFNEDAFASYGQKQGANAPTSKAAAHAYGAALNSLLGVASRQRLQIGDATVVFWADTSGVGEVAAQAAEDAFAFLAEPADDSSEAAKIADVLRLAADGRPVSVKDINPTLEPGTKFHVLGLSPNSARLSIRFWITESFGFFTERLAQHYRDLNIEPAPWGAKLPAVQRVLYSLLVPKGTKKPYEYLEKNYPGLAGETTRAVLEGALYPRTLLAAALIRLRAGDDPSSGWHAAVIKAYLNRSTRSEKERLPVALDPNRENDPAYHLGRLFYVLEAAQREALGKKLNATIADRYYGSASATPARVFGPLLRALRNHISDAHKQNKGWWIDEKVAEIMSKLPPSLPRTLKLEEQGRFAVGYYHERATRPVKSTDEPASAIDDTQSQEDTP